MYETVVRVTGDRCGTTRVRLHCGTGIQKTPLSRVHALKVLKRTDAKHLCHLSMTHLEVCPITSHCFVVTVVLGTRSKTTCPKGGHDLQSWERQNKRLVQRSGRDWGVGVRAARLNPKYGSSYALSSLSFFVCLLVLPISWLIYSLL